MKNNLSPLMPLASFPPSLYTEHNDIWCLNFKALPRIWYQMLYPGYIFSCLFSTFFDTNISGTLLDALIVLLLFKLKMVLSSLRLKCILLLFCFVLSCVSFIISSFKLNCDSFLSSSKTTESHFFGHQGFYHASCFHSFSSS